MTNSEFIKIKLTAHKSVFKNIIGLTESSKTSELIDFCRMMHPKCALDAQGSRCNVYTGKSHFIYVIYSGHILKTNVYAEIKTLYKL